MKFLLLILVVGAVLWWLFGRSRARMSGPADKPRDAVALVTCAHCGVRLPHDDAVTDGAKAYCSEAHRLAGPKDHGSA